MPDLMVWHAAALAVGLDPDSLRFHRESDFAGPSGPLFDSASFPAPAAEREFERALRLLHVAVITPDGPLQVKAPSAFGKPRESRIDLREAVAFLAGKGWALPTELRAHTEQEEAASAAAAPSELRWTPDRLEELKTYRKQHGTKNAAEHFCISEGRVRQLLPGSKREPAARTASNPFGMAASKKR